MNRLINLILSILSQKPKEVKKEESLPMIFEQKVIISYEDYITAQGKYPDRLKSPELTEDLKKNAESLLLYVNEFLEYIGVTYVNVSSGFRPSDINKTVSGAGAKSNHLICLAIDIKDDGCVLWQKFLDNLDKAQELGIFAEDKRWTPSWLHLQCVPPKSGKRIFVPSSSPALDSKLWDGKYDGNKYDLKKN